MSRARPETGDLALELEYDRLAERAHAVLIALIALLSFAVVPNWPYVALVYSTQVVSHPLSLLGYSVLYTALLGLAMGVSAILPRFEASFRPRGFRTSREARHIEIDMFLALSLLSVMAMALLALSLQLG